MSFVFKQHVKMSYYCDLVSFLIMIIQDLERRKNNGKQSK